MLKLPAGIHHFSFKEKIKYFIPFAFILFHCLGLKAQKIDSIGFILDSTFARSPFYGNILITKNGKTLFEKSYGYADAIKQKPLTNQNSFQVASISKQFTAYGIMLLKNKGLLAYDSSVSLYISDFPYKNITVRQLLNHSSGLPNFWDGIRPFLDTSRSNGNRDVLQYLIQHDLPLQFEPGSEFQYCDIGYDFLANIIENVSGMNYQDFMNKNIFNPLKMRNTVAYKVTDIRKIQNEDLAIGHKLKNGIFDYAHLQPEYNFVFYLGDFYGDGSVVSTARDLATWSKALDVCSLLPCGVQNESLAEPTYKEKTVFARRNPDITYGFGWFMKNTGAGKLLYHTGGHPGNRHSIYRLPNHEITFIFLSNTETPNISFLRNRILTLLN